jgi:hypothetical protein
MYRSSYRIFAASEAFVHTELVAAVCCQDLQHRGLRLLQLMHVRAHPIELTADVAQVLQDDVICCFVGHGGIVAEADGPRNASDIGEMPKALNVLGA